jgi:tetratricopeptide (TPR) repeat protein
MGHGWSLVGRERELATLRTLLGVAGGGRGRTAVVLGEPGIGKTALVEAFAAGAQEQGVRVAWGRCTERDAPAFWPWRQALRALGAGALADAAQARASGAAASRAELFARVVDDLSAADLPAVVVVEDIHWADAASLALLRFLVDALPGLPVLLVATSRDDPMEAGPQVRELLRSLPPGVERLALSGLERDDVAAVVARILGRPPDAELAAQITDRCGGNPFFVREVAQLHASCGAGASLAIPSGVRQVLERRLARLSPPCRDLLAAAAVAGEPEPTLLAEVTSRPYVTVLHHLGEAVTARLLHSDATRLRFAHALVRETLYAQQPPATVGDLHLRVAEALARRGADAAEVATHWRRAVGQNASEAAARWALTAAREARGRMGYEQAVRFYEWALESPPEEELALRIELGEAQVLAGALTAGRDTLRDAARQARRAGRQRELARAVLGAGVGGFEVALQDDEQLALLEEALPTLASPEDDALRAAVLTRLSLAGAERRPVNDRVGLAEGSIALARTLGDAVTEVEAQAAWCDARSGPDHVDARLERANRMVALAQRSGDPASLLLARRLRLVALSERGEFGAVDAEVDAYAQAAGRLRLPLYVWPVPIWRGARALMSGDLDATRQYLAEAQDLATRADSVNATLLGLVLKLWLLGATDEQAELAATTHELFDVVARHHPHGYLAAGHLAMAGRLDEAHRRLHHRLAAGLESIPKDAEWLQGMWLLAEAALALHETAAAEPLYEAMRPYAHRWAINGIFAGCSGLTAHQLGRLASLLGRRDEARDWLEEALAAHRAAGAGLLVSRTERALAELGRPVRRTTAPAAATEGEFRRSGRTWQVRWMESSGTVPDSKGMRDLALLLAAPEREVSVLDLVEVAGGPPRAAAGGHAGERLDKPARAAYRRRLSELEGELAEAEANADTGRMQALGREKDFLAAELAGALGLGGRARLEADPVERARKAVSMRIRTALKAIAEVNPGLARHLDRSVTTGRLCSYRPEQPVIWRM